jgi:hypothetical protein
MIRKSILCLLVALSGMASASELVFKGGGYFAHFCDGGGCQSLITVVNLEAVPNPYILSFFNDTGAPQSVVTDSGASVIFAGTLQPFESKTITTSGVALSQVQGWVDLSTPGIVGGSVMFRINLAPWINSEALVPIDFGYPRYLLSFNEADGSSNGFAVTNPMFSTSLTVSVVIRDGTGQTIATDSFVLPPHNHQSFVLNKKYPAVVGKLGSIDVSIPVGSTFSSWISVVGFRFGSNAVSTILPITSTAWISGSTSASQSVRAEPDGSESLQ